MSETATSKEVYRKERCIFLLTAAILFFTAATLSAQVKLSTELRLGFSLDFYKAVHKTQQYPGSKFFASFIISGENDGIIMTNYGASLAVYNRSIGNHLNPLITDIQMDFTNSFSIGVGSNKQNENVKYLRTLGNSPYYNLKHNRDYAVFAGTNFLWNNHKRHQSIFSFEGTIKNISFCYYNDGAAPTGFFADQFDRWWTGGGYVFLHADSSYNIAEFSFDQFTGFSPLTYEFSNMLGLDVLDYNENVDSLFKNSDDKYLTYTSSSYNTAMYTFRFHPNKNYSFDAGIMGDLKRYNDKTDRYVHYSVQDLIHIALKHPLHPNEDVNRYFVGTTFNYSIYDKPYYMH